MAFFARLQGLSGVELLCAGFDVAIAAIDAGQLGSQAEDRDVDGFATLAAKMVFGGFDDAPGEAGALTAGVDCELTEIATRATHFRVDATHELAQIILSDQNGTFVHHVRKARFVGSRAFEEGFDGEGGIDKQGQTLAVGGDSGSKLQAFAGHPCDPVCQIPERSKPAMGLMEELHHG